MPPTTKPLPPPTGRRERRVRENRQRILRAAHDLFRQHGVDAVTMEEIADHADVARGTVFNHFPSKENLCLEMGSLQVDMLIEAIAQGRVPGPTPTEKLEQAFRLMAELPQANPDNYRRMLVRVLTAMQPGELPEHRRRLLMVLERWVAEAQATGELRGDLTAGRLARYLMGLQLQASLIWAFGFVEGTLADHISRQFRLSLEGIQGGLRQASGPAGTAEDPGRDSGMNEKGEAGWQ